MRCPYATGIFVIALALLLPLTSRGLMNVERCYNISGGSCRGLNYSLTSTSEPVTFDNATRQLIASNCSTYAEQFLCLARVPSCHEITFVFNGTLRRQAFAAFPCREFCVTVQRQCADYQWPAEVDCSSLPAYNSTTDVCHVPSEIIEHFATTVPTVSTPTQEPASCPGLLVVRSGVQYGGVYNCASSCHYMYSDGHLTAAWATTLLVVWSVLSLVSLATFVCFVLSWKEYLHIEVPYYFVVACHIFIPIAFVVRLAAGHEGVVCDEDYQSANSTALVTHDASHGVCTVTFFFTYYFILAGAVWLMNLPFGLCTLQLHRWRYFLHASYHIAGWGLPLVLVIVACVTGMVSGDNITGLCWLDPKYSSYMLVAPLVFCMVGGMAFLVVNLYLIFFYSRAVKEFASRNRDVIKRSYIFFIMGTVELVVIIIVNLIENMKYEEWENYYTECVAAASPKPDCASREFTQRPYALQVLQWSTVSAVAALTLCWPLSRKITYKCWRQSFEQLCYKIWFLWLQCRPSKILPPQETSL